MGMPDELLAVKAWSLSSRQRSATKNNELPFPIAWNGRFLLQFFDVFFLLSTQTPLYWTAMGVKGWLVFAEAVFLQAVCWSSHFDL